LAETPQLPPSPPPGVTGRAFWRERGGGEGAEESQIYNRENASIYFIHYSLVIAIDFYSVFGNITKPRDLLKKAVSQHIRITID
jgi:hypothetical protein